MSSDRKQSILIVDDEPANIRILAELLKSDYELTVATSGPEALRLAAHTSPPDLILLDIWIPHVDGYEVCRRLKTNPATRDIPIIFITMMSEEEDEAKGLSLGAIDYITKPFSPMIVKARVRTHLELKRHRDLLEELAEERARQLVHADRLATLGTLSAGIAHEINNSLTCISGFGIILKDTIIRDLDELTEVCADNASLVEKSFEYKQEMLEMLTPVLEASDRMSSIIKAMRNFSRRDSGGAGPCDIAECIQNALRLGRNVLKKSLKAELDFPDDLPLLQANCRQLEQVFLNLIKNAADAIGVGTEGLIRIRVYPRGGEVVIVFHDSGPGIPAEKLETIWEPFFTTKDAEGGTGLGLPISKGIIEDHGGRMVAANDPDGGASFTIYLPVKSMLKE